MFTLLAGGEEQTWQCDPVDQRRTSFHLQQSLGQHTSCHADGLADVEARVLGVDVRDDQLSAHGNGVPTGLRRWLTGKQQHLDTSMHRPSEKDHVDLVHVRRRSSEVYEKAKGV